MTLQGLLRRGGGGRGGPEPIPGQRGLRGGQGARAGMGGGLSRMALVFPATLCPSRLLSSSDLGFLVASGVCLISSSSS